jgi:hypothetical protein
VAFYELHYMDVRAVRYMTWLECAGWLDETSYYKCKDVLRLLTLLVQRVNDHDIHRKANS